MWVGNNNNWIGWVTTRAAVASRWSLGAVFFVSGWSHLQNELLYYADVRAYEVLPGFMTSYAAVAIPSLLLFVGAGLIIDRLGLVATSIGAIALLVFLGAQMLTILTGKTIDCGCFGVLHQEQVGYGTVARTTALFALALIVIYHYRGVSTSVRQTDSDT